jgi:pilus assembly protein CpaE
MADRIKVLIVDDIPETRDHLSKLLGFESDVEVVGAAAGGPRRSRWRPSMQAGRRPDGHQHAGMDGITATEKLAAEVPTAA